MTTKRIVGFRSGNGYSIVDYSDGSLSRMYANGRMVHYDSLLVPLPKCLSNSCTKSELTQDVMTGELSCICGWTMRAWRVSKPEGPTSDACIADLAAILGVRAPSAIGIDEPGEEPISERRPDHRQACGSEYRGCAPNCMARLFDAHDELRTRLKEAKDAFIEWRKTDAKSH